MKRLLLLIAAFCCITAASAQKRDVIYLKNGSVVKGAITEIADAKVKVSTKDGSVFVFSMDEIDRMTKEERQKPDVRFRDKARIGITAGYVISSNLWTVELDKNLQGSESATQGGRMKTRLRHGFTAGVTGEYRLPKNFTLEVGGMFSMTGYTYSDKGDDGYRMDITNFSIDIPVSAVYYFGGYDRNGWQVMLGVKPTLNVAGKMSVNDSLLERFRLAGNSQYVPVYKDSVPLFNLGAVVGVGYGPVRLTGYYSFLSTMTDEFKNVTHLGLFYVTKRNNAFGASLTYTYKF